MILTSPSVRKGWCAGILSLLIGLIDASAAVINSPSSTAINAAIAAPLILYRKSFSGGAYTNGAYFGGASVTLAVASHAGNTSSDARLLQQMRTSITGGNEPCANGGYPAQHESHATGMFAIAKQTPRIWDQLTAAEKTKVNLVMKAALVASAFTTSDTNPYVLAGSQQYTLDADPNLDRNWNPNYREGMLGGVLIGRVYFGGPTAAAAILDTYNHTQFVAELNSHGLNQRLHDLQLEDRKSLVRRAHRHDDPERGEKLQEPRLKFVQLHGDLQRSGGRYLWQKCQRRT